MIDLTHLNSMALQSQAIQYICLEKTDEIKPLFQQLQKNKQKFIILSGGSNMILPPKLNAHVISPKLLGKHLICQNDDNIWLQVMAGENWHDLVVETVNQGWYGLENLALIPGWVGACPVQNIGAYGVQVSDVIESVMAFHIPTLTWQKLNNIACQFTYRDSLFKQQMGDWLIGSVIFKLNKQPKFNVQYANVMEIAQQYASQSHRDEIHAQDVMSAVIQIRQSKLPDPNTVPNCGSFFKNPIIHQDQLETLLKDFSDLVYYPMTKSAHHPPQVKLAAGWLIEKAGLKGKGIEPMITYQKQALVLINQKPYFATQADVEKTMRYIMDVVYDKFAVLLEHEPIWIQPDGNIYKHY